MEAESQNNSYHARRQHFKQYIEGDGVEIGALHNPLDISGQPITRILYVDRYDPESLRAHYPELNHRSFVPVDIVDDGQVLGTVPDESLDFVIANQRFWTVENDLWKANTRLWDMEHTLWAQSEEMAAINHKLWQTETERYEQERELAQLRREDQERQNATTALAEANAILNGKNAHITEIERRLQTIEDTILPEKNAYISQLEGHVRGTDAGLLVRIARRLSKRRAKKR